MKKPLSLYGRSRSPIYAQVASVMRQRIENGEWVVGQKISTLETLEKEFGVARVTIRQSIEMLRDEGLLEAHQGRGTFVSGVPKRGRWLNIATDFEAMVTSFRENVLRRISVETDVVPPEVAEGEGKLAEAYVFLRSIQHRDGEPFSVVNLFLAKHIYDSDPDGFQHVAALVRLAEMEDLTITHAHQTLTIGVSSPETSDLLKIGLGEPTADCRLILADQNDTAIYVANIHYVKSCFSLRMDLLQTSGPRQGRVRTRDHA